MLVWETSLCVLNFQTLLSEDGIEIAEVACRHRRGRGNPEPSIDRHALVFVRRGCFVRSVDGVTSLLDPTLAYGMCPGQEQRYDHPHAGGDDCTTVFVEPALLATLWGGEPMLPVQPMPTSPRIDLEHRLLLSACRRQEDRHEQIERALGLLARLLVSAISPPWRLMSASPTSPISAARYAKRQAIPLRRYGVSWAMGV